MEWRLDSYGSSLFVTSKWGLTFYRFWHLISVIWILVEQLILHNLREKKESFLWQIHCQSFLRCVAHFSLFCFDCSVCYDLQKSLTILSSSLVSCSLYSSKKMFFIWSNCILQSFGHKMFFGCTSFYALVICN